MKSKVRRTIERWVKNPDVKRKPTTLGTDAVVVVFPAKPGARDLFYVVATYRRFTSKNDYTEVVCSCPPFRFNSEDKCEHILALQEQLEEVGLWP